MAVADYEPIIQAAAQEWNVDPTLVKAVMHQETGGNATDAQGRPITSPTGVRGLMQITGATARHLGVTDVTDPVQAIYGGTKYLSELLDEHKDPAKAVYAYNGGSDPDYAKKVAGHYQKFAKEAVPAATPVSGSKDDDVDAFLKRTGATTEEKNPLSESVDAFLSRTGAKSGVPAASTLAMTPNDISGQGRDEYGNPTGQLGAGPIAAPMDARATGLVTREAIKDAAARLAGAVSSIEVPAGMRGTPGGAMASAPAVDAIGQAVARGFGTEPLGMGNKLVAALRSSGVYGPEGGGNLLQQVNEGVLGPAAYAAEAGLRGAGALFKGGQEAVAQAGAAMGAPQLGRDVAAMPEAFAGSPEQFRGPVNRLASPTDRPQLISERFAPSTIEGQSTLDRIGQLIRHDDAGAGLRAPDAPVANRLAPMVDTSVGGSVGAAASRENSPAGAIDMTSAEMKSNRRQAEMKQILAPAQANDTNIYVEGSLPTKAQYSGDPTVSQAEIMLRQRNPGAFEGEGKRLTEQNTARVDKYENLTPSDTALTMKAMDRDARWQADTKAILPTAKPADLAPAESWVKSTLSDPRLQERDEVRAVIKPLMDRLYDADGKLKTDPASVWGMHDNLMDKLAKAKDGTSAERYVIKQLKEFKDVIDGVMNVATDNRFQTALDNYAQASKEINAGELLRGFRAKLTNSKGEIQAQRFHNFVRDIAEARGNKGIDPAMDIPDETMQGLIHINEDLKRAGHIDLGKARGSPTDLFGTLAKGLGIGAAHIGAGFASPGLGNIAVQTVIDKGGAALGRMRLNKLTREHLAPPPTGYNRLDAPE